MNIVFDANGNAETLVYKTKFNQDGQIGYGKNTPRAKTQAEFGEGCLVAYQLGFVAESAAFGSGSRRML